MSKNCCSVGLAVHAVKRDGFLGTLLSVDDTGRRALTLRRRRSRRTASCASRRSAKAARCTRGSRGTAACWSTCRPRSRSAAPSWRSTSSCRSSTGAATSGRRKARSRCAAWARAASATIKRSSTPRRRSRTSISANLDLELHAVDRPGPDRAGDERWPGERVRGYPDSIVAPLGFENGDTRVRVNGIELTEAEQALPERSRSRFADRRAD